MSNSSRFPYQPNGTARQDRAATRIDVWKTNCLSLQRTAYRQGQRSSSLKFKAKGGCQITTVVGRAVGVDLHPNKFTVYFLEDAKGVMKSYFISEMDEFMKELRKDDVLAVEASTPTFEFVSRIKDKLKEVYVVNPIKYGIIHKTNRKLCGAL